MQKNTLVTVLIMLGSIVLFSFANASKNNVEPVYKTVSVDSNIVETKPLSEKLYADLHLDSAGLSKQTVEYAVKGYEKLLNEGTINNDQYLTIVDFSQNSRKKR